jgi:AAA+ superfamily predicted ATPase
MKSLRVPGWLASGMLERYHSGASHLFLLHGNVRGRASLRRGVRPLASGSLATLFAQRPYCVSYDVSSGLAFPDAEHDKAFKKILGIKQPRRRSDARSSCWTRCSARTAARPAPSRSSWSSRMPIAPAGTGGAERWNITQLALGLGRAPAAPARLIVLVAPNATDVSDEVYAGASGAEVVEAPRPDVTLRADFAATLQDRYSEVTWQMTQPELAAETGGLSLVQMEDIVQRARSSREPLARPAILERKIDLLRQEYSDVLEILNPRYDLSAVGGLEHAVTELREVADIMKRGLTSAAPMGMILMGPPGTGKSFLAECFAKECGMLCVRFRPLRGMYVGQSERNQEKAFSAIRALAPVVVIVDESDQAEGGSRDQGSGDSGVTERMRASGFNFWADNSLRGKVLRIDSTNRVDLIDSAMRRSGRTDLKIPILMPDEQARRQILEVQVKKHKLQTTIKDFAPFAARTPGYTGADLELALTTAYRFALRDGASAISDAHLSAALDDLIPAAQDQRAIDKMTLLALDECRNKRLLPRNAEAIRKEIQARMAATS